MASLNTIHVSSPRTLPSAGSSDTARVRLLDSRPSGLQKLPFKTEVSAATRHSPSNAAPNELYRSVEERKMAIIELLSLVVGLCQAREEDKRYNEQISRTQFPQADISFSHDQINILNTLLR